MFFKGSMAALMLVATVSLPATAQEFKLTSTTISEGEKLSNTHVFQGFGCNGTNQSPQLSWTGVPKGTKSFAITAYDPDAPTGSGWWHWNVVNIPASVRSLPQGASGQLKLPGVKEIRNDYGTLGFGGACPPPGEVHRYVFTVYALGKASLTLPKNPSNALVGFMTRANSLGSASITAVYHR